LLAFPGKLQCPRSTKFLFGIADKGHAMKWEGNRESDNVEDRRGMGGFGGKSIGAGSIVIVLIASYFFGVDPSTVLDLLSGGSGNGSSVQQTSLAGPPANDHQTKFVRTVLADTEDTWTALLREQGTEYVPPKLDLFTGSYPTACGAGQSAAGPFYCPADQKIYIDLSFFELMQERFKVSGEFA
jgi:predicted metalloprotease